jgi:DNA polymerase III subunit beta
MQIQIERENLLKPIGVVAGVVERRQTLPILSYILVRVSDDKVTFTGTDLEVEVVAAVAPSRVEGEGEFTVPARKLLDICRALPEKAVITILKQGERVVIKAGKSRFSLSTLPPKDFPVVEGKSFEQALTISQGTLKVVIERAAFCMAQQDVRYYLNGLYVEMNAKRLRAVATDGHRMALTDAECQGPSKPVEMIIPRKGVQEIGRLLGMVDDPVRMEVGANHIRLFFSDLVFTSKLIDGKFPDYSKVIPPSQNKTLRLSRMVFREALGRVAILANEKYKGVRLGLEPGRLTISAHNPEQEEAAEELETAYDGEALEIGFNVGYLLEASAAIEEQEILLGLNDPNSSCTLRPPEDGGTQYIVMPMRL